MNMTGILRRRRPATIGAPTATDQAHGGVEPDVVGCPGASEDIETADHVEVPPRGMMQPRELRADRLASGPSLVQMARQENRGRGVDRLADFTRSVGVAAPEILREPVDDAGRGVHR